MEKLSRIDEERLLSLQAQGHIMPQPMLPLAPSAIQDNSLSKVGALDTPPRLDLQKTEEGLKGISMVFKDENGNPIPPEDLVLAALKALATLNTQSLAVKKESIEKQQGWMFEQERRRENAYDKHFASVGTANSWGRVARSLTSFGLIASGVAGLAAGFGALAVSSVVVGTCFVIDQLLDDKVKKLVASWMARGENERQEVWLDRIHLFCAVTSFALSMGINASQAVQIAMGLSKSLVTGAKGVVDWRVSSHKALIVELDDACRTAQKSLEAMLNELQDISSSIYQFYDNIHHIEEMRKKLQSLMLQFNNFV